MASRWNKWPNHPAAGFAAGPAYRGSSADAAHTAGLMSIAAKPAAAAPTIKRGSGHTARRCPSITSTAATPTTATIHTSAPPKRGNWLPSHTAHTTVTPVIEGSTQQ